MSQRCFSINPTEFSLLEEGPYDPTYGNTDSSAVPFLECELCAAIVHHYQRHRHQGWHDSLT